LEHRIRDAFEVVRAEDKLKQDTYAYLREKAYRRKRRVMRRLVSAVVSIIFVLFAGLFSYNAYFEEAAVIDIDVNPSIEIKINRFDRVIGTYAYNEDGQGVLDAVDIRNMTYQEALASLIVQMADKGYIGQGGLFSATVQAADGKGEEGLLTSLEAYLNEALQADGAMVEQDVFIVDFDTKAHSHEQNMTPAKYLAILELQSYDASATFESCRDHSLGEIKRETHRHMIDDSHEEGDSDHADGNDGSHGEDDSDHVGTDDSDHIGDSNHAGDSDEGQGRGASDHAGGASHVRESHDEESREK
jgi:hypothetical protein